MEHQLAHVRITQTKYGWNVIRVYSRTARVADEMSNEVHFACISLTRKKEVKLATGL